MNPDQLSDISLALTADDIKKLIADGTIRKKQKIGISRGRTRVRNEKIKRNQMKGFGNRKGAKNAGYPRKEQWINRIRPQRRYLKALRDKGMLEKTDYRKVYKKAKGGQYRTVSYLRNQLEENNLIKTPSTSRARRR
jgi:large subunit ribosomal protein L19e